MAVVADDAGATTNERRNTCSSLPQALIYEQMFEIQGLVPVSYKHLTLPTNMNVLVWL